MRCNNICTQTKSEAFCDAIIPSQVVDITLPRRELVASFRLDWDRCLPSFQLKSTAAFLEALVANQIFEESPPPPPRGLAVYSREIVNAPPPSPHFLPRGHSSGRGGVHILKPPPLMGGRGIKFGPVSTGCPDRIGTRQIFAKKKVSR